MSWDVRLVDEDGDTVAVESHTEGAVYAVGGSTQATTTITWNYSYFYYNEIDTEEGFRWLDGKTAAETVDVLADAIETLGTDPHDDCESYWCPSIGRAGAALEPLLEWAKSNPDATWEVV